MNLHNRFKVSINIVQLFAVIVLILCIDNVYVINKALKYTSYFYILRLIFCLFVLTLFLFKKYLPSKITSMIVVFYAYIFLLTIINNGDLVEAIKVYSRPLTIVLFIDIFWKKRKQYFSIWIMILLALVLFDGISMLLYPEGMYNTVTFDMYTLNWFLGYKTARYEYSMPLCVILGYLSCSKRNKFGRDFFLILIICGVQLLYSQAMGALISIIIIGCFCLIANAYIVFTNKNIPFYKICSGKVVVFSYIILLLSVFFLERIPLIRYIVENVFKKNVNLTGRTYIWEKCFEVILRNPILGNGYLAFEDYVEVTGFIQMGSAHNLFLNILVCSGIIGLIMYIKIIISAYDFDKYTYNGTRFILMISIISYLIIGIVSDSMFSALFGFPLFQILYLEGNSSEDRMILYDK